MKHLPLSRFSIDGVKSPIRPSAKVSRVGFPMKSSARESSWYLFSVVLDESAPWAVEQLFGADDEVSDDDLVGELLAIVMHVLLHKDWISTSNLIKVFLKLSKMN